MLGRAKFLMVPALLGSSISIQAATILTENFNALTPQLTATSAGAFSTTGGTNIDIVGGSLFGTLCVAPAAGNCIDLDGTGGLSQGILQTTAAITLSPGVSYFLSFDLLGSGRSVTTSTTVMFGLYSQTFTLASADVTSGIVANQLVTVPSDTVTNLTFRSNTAGNVGAVLDNVVISTEPTASPEPSTATLIGGVLLGLGLLGRPLFQA